MLGKLATVRLVRKGMGYKMNPGAPERLELLDRGLLYPVKQLEKLLPNDSQNILLSFDIWPSYSQKTLVSTPSTDLATLFYLIEPWLLV